MSTRLVVLGGLGHPTILFQATNEKKISSRTGIWGTARNLA